MAERVRVLHGLGAEHQSAGREVLEDRRIGVLEEQTADERRRFIREVPLAVDGLERRPTLAPADLEILGAERRCHVHDPGAVPQ